MYISAYPSLDPRYLLERKGSRPPPFPFSAPNRTYGYLCRNLIYHLFQSLDLQNGDLVLVPEYHHGNEIRAIRAAGASLRFYPIKRNLEIDLHVLDNLTRLKPRALLVIHYLGFPQPMEAICALCRERGITLIEDCALSLLSHLNGQPLGGFGDYALFSLYKTLPFPDGGLLVQNRNVLEKLNQLPQTRPDRISVSARIAHLILEWTREHHGTLGATLASLKLTLGRALSVGGIRRLPVGNSGFDLHSVHTAMSGFSQRLIGELDYQQLIDRRRENYLLLRQKLAGKIMLLREDLSDGVCPLFFPLLVKNKQEAARVLCNRGIEAIPFWNFGDPEADEQGSRDTRFLRKHVLKLPIQPEVSLEQIDYMGNQVLGLKHCL